MNQLFEMLPISSPPEKDGWYTVYWSIDLNPNFYYFKQGRWYEEKYTADKHPENDVVVHPRYMYLAPVSGGMRWRKCLDFPPKMQEDLSLRLPNRESDGNQYGWMREAGYFDIQKGSWHWLNGDEINQTVLDQLEYLDEGPSTPDELEELKKENDRLRTLIEDQAYSIWKGCDSDLKFEEWKIKFLQHI